MTNILKGLRVLLVEDEPLLAMVTEEMLLEQGADVLGPAASVEAAVALADEGGIDLAILDVNLRGDRSDAAADALAARHIPFLFTTGHGREALRARHRDKVCLVKPFTEAELLAVVAALAAKR
ncbi:response regulator [Niveispirillum sp. KHB5.9]|uniref:response regulator n=1 Tax=Niveispirillum sp. KHB5.9 TaxID=3400269 RepID=UPI003A849592